MWFVNLYVTSVVINVLVLPATAQGFSTQCTLVYGNYICQHKKHNESSQDKLLLLKNIPLNFS